MFVRFFQLALPLLRSVESEQRREALRLTDSSSIVPSRIALTASHPHLREVWERLWQQYFPDRPDLSFYHVVWSDRGQRSCLASCNPRAKRVNVAKVLQHPLASEILEPLLYHEMCHAVLGPPQRINGRFVIHGAEFKALERRHPQIPLLNQWIKEGHWARLVALSRADRGAARRRRRRKGRKR